MLFRNLLDKMLGKSSQDPNLKGHQKSVQNKANQEDHKKSVQDKATQTDPEMETIAVLLGYDVDLRNPPKRLTDEERREKEEFFRELNEFNNTSGLDDHKNESMLDEGSPKEKSINSSQNTSSVRLVAVFQPDNSSLSLSSTDSQEKNSSYLDSPNEVVGPILIEVAESLDSTHETVGKVDPDTFSPKLH